QHFAAHRGTKALAQDLHRHLAGTEPGQPDLAADLTQPAGNLFLEVARRNGDREFALEPVGAGFCHLHGSVPVVTKTSAPPGRAGVRAGGLNPHRFASLDPKPSASANSATPAARAAGAIPPPGLLSIAACDIESAGSHQVADRGRGGDLPFAAISLVVGFDL